MKIRRNVLCNFAGFLFPAIVLFVSYPVLLRVLGAGQFGLLALATSLAASLSFLDFGLSSASLRFIVADLDRGDPLAAGKVITTSLCFFGGMGTVISLAMFLLAPWLAGRLHVDASQWGSAVAVFRVTALQIAFSLVLNAISGILKALDRFDLSAAIITVLAVVANGVPAWLVASVGLPLVSALIGASLLLAMLCAGSVFLTASVARRKGIALREAPPDRATLHRTMGFGAYLMLHSTVGMLFTHGQRVLVGFLFGPATLAAFQLSLTIVSKVHAAVNAVAEVALPIASGSSRDRIRRLYPTSMLSLAVLSAAPLLLLGIAGQSVLRLWLGHDAPPLSAQIMPALCVAYFFVAVAALPFHIINGLGRPRMNVFLGVGNLAVYCVALAVYELAGGLTALHMAMAYAISNAAAGLAYQVYCRSLVQQI